MTQTDMTPLQRLAKVLQLGTPSNYRNHTYINGESLYFPTGRVYGGQVIAQSVMAASRTVALHVCRIRYMAISLPPAIFVKICCLTSKIFVTDVPSPPVGSTSRKPRGRFSRPSPASRNMTRKVWNLPIRCLKTFPIPKR